MPGLSFLNVAFLAGLAAAALPILIHLFSRRRARRIEWSSTRFLREVNRQRIRRVKLRQLLLLLLRIAAIALFALAMGRPALTGNLLRHGGKAPSTACILIDTSGSMWAARDGEPAFSKARERAAEVLSLLGEGDEAYVVTVDETAESVTPYAVQDLDLLRGQVAKVEPTYRAGTMHEGLVLAARLLGGSHNLNRELYVISDMQRSAWLAAADTTRAPLALPEGATVCLLGFGDDRVENISVDHVVVAHDRLHGRGVSLEVELTNHTDREQGAIPVTAYIGDERVGEVFAKLEPGASARVAIDLGPGPFAQRSGYVRIPEDALAIDDVRHFLLGDERRPRVGIVADPGGLGGTFVRLALEPEAGAGPYAAQAIAAADLGRTDLREINVVVLAGPGQLKQDGIERLRAFVRDGGGLLIFPGEGSDLRFYNDRLLAGILPIKLAGVVETRSGGAAGGSEPGAGGGAAGSAGDPRKPPARGMFQLTPAVPGHPVFTGFGATLGERLTQARFDQVVKVLPGSARVIAEFRPDLPALVEGEGVMFFASSVDRAWNDLPTSGAFVPLIHQTVSYLARAHAQANEDLAGAPLERLVPAPASPRRYRVIAPDASELPVETVDRGAFQLLRTPPLERPGIYRLVDDANAEVALAAVNPDPREGDLQVADVDRVQAIFGDHAFSYLSGERDVRTHVREIRQGRELWRPILLLALTVLVIEVLLSRGKGAFTPAAS